MNKKLTPFLIAGVAGACITSAVADEHGHMHHAFPKDVDAFHSVLAPIWHARPGKERLDNACAKASEMQELAKGIRSSDASALAASIATLKAKCQGNQADVDAVLFDVHEAFHRLIEAKPAVSAR